MVSDLPEGYRWAREDEVDREDAIVVKLTVSANGNFYTQDEADIAVPLTVDDSLERENKFFQSYTDRGINPFKPYEPTVEDMLDEADFQDELWRSGYYQ
jgi:hypothetical protein